MKPPLFCKVTVLLLLFCGGFARADWQWENDLASATPTTEGYQAKLTFTNKGDKDITVTGLTFSCSCTVFHFTATTAKPGKEGVLTIVLENGKEVMPGRELSVIVTGSPSTKARELTLRLEAPEKTKPNPAQS